eukprot:CAMPEP_0194441914 /NCGR_PEP_ID=MMETSP0176-20130528/124100_1 /TAXON_ID=216777 /ORGANISM="Proboscia alata, Strain PI-D3" /LENGTH=107 /DNA_ID=CAMNT_0039267661 /DNA_START=290 /DNA_END=614 /DNA_ORIENTATION=+
MTVVTIDIASCNVICDMSSLLDSLGLTYDVAKLSKIIESGERNERADEKRSKKKFSLGTTDLKYDFELESTDNFLYAGIEVKDFYLDATVLTKARWKHTRERDVGMA